jgi:hypothetical protein
MVGAREIKTLRQILIMLELADYQAYIQAGLRRWIVYVANIFSWHRNARLIWRNSDSTQPEILLTDKLDTPTVNDTRRVIYLCYDYSPNLKLEPGHFAMPETMHPQIYVQYQEHKRLVDYRKSKRKIRLLFSGNYEQHGYENPFMTNFLGKLTRPQILSFLESKQQVRMVTSQAELDNILTGDYWNGFVWIDSQRFRINQQYWLATVAQSDFFLCPPGLLLPLSHNAVEAMAVGTIPFINYPEWFFPNLSDSVNCITFSSLTSLHDKLEVILRMNDAQIQTMREQVIQYYLNHLCLEEFAKRLLMYPDNKVYLHLWEENELAIRRVMDK